MKQFLIILLLTNSTAAFAQPTPVKQAIIYTTTNVVAPEEEDAANIQTQGGPGGMNFRNFGDGETKSVIYLKDDLMKTVIKTDMGRSTIIRNNATKMTTTLLEIMGNKTGFYASDEDQAQMRKRMDSMMQARQKDSGAVVRRPAETPAVKISYTEETKKIAGYNCKKAYVIATRLLGLQDTTVVWYTPDIKINNLTSTGGSGATIGMAMVAGNNSSPLGALSELQGFVMQYETKMRRGRVMTVHVTKIETNKEIAAKEFDVPKDFEVKPMSEMANMIQGGQGNFFMRRRD